MSASVVEMGMALRARASQPVVDPFVQLAAAAEATRELELAAVGGSLVELLSTVISRLAGLEAEVVGLRAQVVASRVRRPVRDDLGTILYVVDELTPPVWAQPVDAPPVGPVSIEEF